MRLVGEPQITAITLAELSPTGGIDRPGTLRLHTCNLRDLTGIEELTVVAVPRPDH